MQGPVRQFFSGGLPSTMEMASTMVGYKAEETQGELSSSKGTGRCREEGKERPHQRQSSTLLSGAGDDGELPLAGRDRDLPPLYLESERSEGGTEWIATRALGSGLRIYTEIVVLV
jgi:hypothetical protein